MVSIKGTITMRKNNHKLNFSFLCLIFDKQESKIIPFLLDEYYKKTRKKKKFHAPRNKIRPITNIDKISRTVFDKRFGRKNQNT